MKQIKQIASGNKFNAINIGKFENLNDYVLDLGGRNKINGKIFGGTALKTTGSEFSFQVFPPNTECGFMHTHKVHEELYFFLHGKGEFMVDGNMIPVEEGSVVRVSPDGKRSVRNNGNEPLIMLCVQYKGDTFTSEDATDGIILSEPVEWE